MVSLLRSRRAFVGVAVAARCQDDVDAVVRQDEAAGAGLRRNLRGNGAHAGRQDRGHEAGALGVHQFGFANRLAGDERRARRSCPVRFSSAFGRSFLRMKFPLALLAGQACHCMSPGESV